MKYELLNYSNLNPPPLTSCSKCDPYSKPAYSDDELIDIQTLKVDYQVNSLLKFGLVTAYSRERTEDININVEKLRKDVYKTKSIGYIRNDYIGLSPSLILYTIGKNERCLTSFQTGMNIDFVYNEKYLYSSEITDSIYYPYQSGNYVILQQNSLDENPRSHKLGFNRLSPFVNLYFEFYGRKKHAAFVMGSSIVFRPVYLKDNTREMYKNYKITPLFIGITYHFR